MQEVTLQAEPRTEVGTRASRRLRERGFLPAIIYGHGAPPQAIALSEHDLEVALSHRQRTLTLSVGGTAEQFLIKEIQYDHLDHHPIHVDLTRVKMDEAVRVQVGIELRGVPKGVEDGGVLDQPMVEVEVECLVTDIPDTLHPLVTELDINDSLLVKDLELPAGVRATDDPEAVVATVRPPTVEEPEEEEVPVEGEEAAEPERITRTRKEDEDVERES